MGGEQIQNTRRAGLSKAWPVQDAERAVTAKAFGLSRILRLTEKDFSPEPWDGSYLCTRPEPSPPASFSTSETLTRLKSPSTECLRADAATANSMAAWVDLPVSRE